jgi:YHS domain-containing protein
VYLRRVFEGKDLPKGGDWALMIRYDDAFVAYLNGKEVARAGVGSGQGAAATNISEHEAGEFERFPLANAAALIVDGKNVLAIEGHNASPDSSDFSLDPYLVQTGGQAAAAKPEPKKEEKAAAKPVNAKCPVSGEPVDAKVTSTFKNQVVAFCCKDCKAKFDKEPDKYADKVKGAAEAKPEEKKPAAAGKAINAKCPLSGKDVNPEATSTYKNQVIAFCCNNCKGKFDKEPEKFIGKVAEFKK